MIDEKKKKKIEFYGMIAFLAVEVALFITFMVMDGVDIFGEGIGNARSTPVKYAGVLVCLAVSIACIFLRGKDGITVTAALAFTAVADLFMLVIDDYYEISLVAFILVQATYAFRIYMINGRKPWISIGVRVVLIAGLFILLGCLNSINLLTSLVAVYFPNLLVNTVESFMLIKSDKRYILFAVGLALFVCCDICVGLHNFGPVLGIEMPTALLNAVLYGIWLFYLPSQTSIALSVGENNYRPFLVRGKKVEREE